MDLVIQERNLPSIRDMLAAFAMSSGGPNTTNGCLLLKILFCPELTIRLESQWCIGSKRCNCYLLLFLLRSPTSAANDSLQSFNSTLSLSLLPAGTPFRSEQLTVTNKTTVSCIWIFSNLSGKLEERENCSKKKLMFHFFLKKSEIEIRWKGFKLIMLRLA